MFFAIVVFSLILAASAVSPNTNKSNADGRVIGGIDYNIKDVPYQLQLLNYEDDHYCGASILSKDYVITAAHCTDGRSAKHLKVRAGASIKNKDGIMIQVTEIHQHADYTPFDYDISILKLETPLQLGSAGIAAIKLPAEGYTPPADYVSLVTGWGREEPNTPSEYNSQLKGVDVPSVSRSICEKAYGDNIITERMICAGYYGEGKKDACTGDSGGPLVQKSNGILIGVVSWGEGCASPNYPGVYTNVVYFRKWIRNIVNF